MVGASRAVLQALFRPWFALSAAGWRVAPASRMFWQPVTRFDHEPETAFLSPALDIGGWVRLHKGT